MNKTPSEERIAGIVDSGGMTFEEFKREELRIEILENEEAEYQALKKMWEEGEG